MATFDTSKLKLFNLYKYKLYCKYNGVVIKKKKNNTEKKYKN